MAEFKGWMRRDSKRRRDARRPANRYTPEQIEQLHSLMRHLRQQRGTLPHGL